MLGGCAGMEIVITWKWPARSSSGRPCGLCPWCASAAWRSPSCHCLHQPHWRHARDHEMCREESINRTKFPPKKLSRNGGAITNENPRFVAPIRTKASLTDRGESKHERRGEREGGGGDAEQARQGTCRTRGRSRPCRRAPAASCRRRAPRRGPSPPRPACRRSPSPWPSLPPTSPLVPGPRETALPPLASGGDAARACFRGFWNGRRVSTGPGRRRASRGWVEWREALGLAIF